MKRTVWLAMLTASFGAGGAMAQTPPPAPETCVADDFRPQLQSLQMPMGTDVETSACIDVTAGQTLRRVGCIASQIGETEHPEFPTPHQCTGLGSDCGGVADFEVLGAGWEQRGSGWSYCVKAVNRKPDEWRFFQIMGE